MIYIKIKKILILSMVILICPIFITGCWNSREITTLAITVCTGIDKTENGYLVTQQILNPKAIASQKALNEAPIVIYTEEGKDLLEIYRKITIQCPRKIYNAHLRMVVFGEDIAKEGIKDILDFFARDHEFRTDFYFIVAKGTTANEVLSVLSNLETIPGIEMHDLLENSEKVWAPTKSMRIIELANSIISDGNNPVLTGIEITEGDINSNSIDALKKSNTLRKLKYTSIGVFKKDRLVGWLDEDEGKGYDYITDNVKTTAGYAYNGKKVKITYEFKSVKSEMKASLVNNKPVINVGIKIVTNIAAVEGDFEVKKKENEEILMKIAEEKVKQLCENVVNKTQKDFKTDIFGFGEVVHRKYPKIWGKVKDNWNNEFVDLPVKITVEVKINQLGQISKPLFMKEK